MAANPMNNISYGLYVLSAKDGEKDNGCIVNTVTQVTASPNIIAVAVNKGNLTRDMILKTGFFNVSVLTEEVPFEIFKRFGFQSGRDVDKLAGFADYERTHDGIFYLNKYSNTVLNCEVTSSRELATHTLFLAHVETAAVLSDAPSLTYAYYHANVKPKPQPQPEKKTGWRCKICGYVYEGEELPPDFVCPWCKHGAEDFERI